MEIKRIIQLRARLEKALLTFLDAKNKSLNARRDMRFINPKGDVYVDENRQLIFLETPALNKDSIKIDISDNSVIFSAEKNISRNSGRKYLQIERTVGTFLKTIPLVLDNPGIKSINHTYRLGVIKIEIEFGGKQ